MGTGNDKPHFRALQISRIANKPALLQHEDTLRVFDDGMTLQKTPNKGNILSHEKEREDLISAYKISDN